MTTAPTNHRLFERGAPDVTGAARAASGGNPGVGVDADADVDVRAEAWRRHPAVVEGAHVVRVRAGELERRRRRLRIPRDRAMALLAWALITLALLAVGMVVAMRQGALPGDALSRVQAARGMVLGRDPHPEAIGFVWGPFPTVFEVPFAWLSRWWPAVTGTGVAAVAVSAVALSATALQLWGWARELRTPRWCATAVIVLTLAHPLVWTAGVNGMSEACWYLFLVVAGRRLTRWLDGDDVVSLAVAGLALGAAYLTRFESLAAIAASVLLVGFLSFRWAPVEALVPPEHRPRTLDGSVPLVERPRLRSAALEAAVLAFPALSAVGVWALACFAIVREPFPQLTSQYGNAAIVAAAGSSIAGIVGDTSPVGRAWFFLRQALAAAGVTAVLGALAVWVSGRTAWRAAVAVAVFGAPLAAQALLSVQGSTFPWFRYVSSGVLLAGALVMVLAGDRRWVRSRWWLPALLCALLVPGIVVSTTVVRAEELGAFDEAGVVRAVLAERDGRRPRPSSAIPFRADEVARYVDRLPGAAPGAVLTDTSSTFAVVAAAPRPELYVVPADRDFAPLVEDPRTFGVRYLLLRGPAAAGDALRARYPGLWEGESGLAEPVATWGSEGDEAGHYRLFRVIDPVGRPPARPSAAFGDRP